MLSSSHGSFLGFGFLNLRGAVAFKTSQQAVFNRQRCCSASKSGKVDSRDKDRQKFVKDGGQVITEVRRERTSLLYSRSNTWNWLRKGLNK